MRQEDDEDERVKSCDFDFQEVSERVSASAAFSFTACLLQVDGLEMMMIVNRMDSRFSERLIGLMLVMMMMHSDPHHWRWSW
jgi:hypothetical protein